jgi:hypothetical protein
VNLLDEIRGFRGLKISTVTVNQLPLYSVKR